LGAARVAVGPDASIVGSAPGPAVIAGGAARGPAGRFGYKMFQSLRAYASAWLDESGGRPEVAAAIAAGAVSEAAGISAGFETLTISWLDGGVMRSKTICVSCPDGASAKDRLS